jgi:hypothetical protein
VRLKQPLKKGKKGGLVDTVKHVITEFGNYAYHFEKNSHRPYKKAVFDAKYEVPAVEEIGDRPEATFEWEVMWDGKG